MLTIVRRTPAGLSKRWCSVLRHHHRLFSESPAVGAHFSACTSGQQGSCEGHTSHLRNSCEREHQEALAFTQLWHHHQQHPFDSSNSGLVFLSGPSNSEVSKQDRGGHSEASSTTSTNSDGQPQEGGSSSSSSGSSSSSSSANADEEKKKEEPSSDDSDAHSQGEGSEKKGPPRKQVHFIERRPTDILETISLPFRHILASTKLFLVGLSFPGGWESEEFKKGAPEAFSYILEFLHQHDIKEVHELRGMLSDKLIERLQEEKPDPAFLNRERKVHFEKLTNVRMNGILWAAVHVDSETGGSYVHVKVLMSATEVFRVGEENDESWHFRRLHRWTFRRDLPNEDWESPGEWHVVALTRIQPHFPRLSEYDG